MKRLLTFFTCTYVVTWICWAAAGAITRGSAPAFSALAAGHDALINVVPSEKE